MTAASSILRVAVVAASLLLAWRAIHVNAVLFEDSGQPRLAWPAAAAPLGGTAGDGVAALAGILDDNPAEAGALLMLAQAREQAGDAAGAAKAFRTALDIAPLGREVLAMSAAHFLRQGDAAGLELLSRLVAGYPDTRARAFPLLATLMAQERFGPAFAAIAARNPGWLAPFVADACARGTDPSRLAALVVDSWGGGKGDAAPAACVIDRLRAAGLWDEAYHAWLNLLAKERRAQVGLVFNGGFEAQPVAGGFDWLLQPAPEKQAGHTAEIVRYPGAEGQRVLRVAYNGKRQSGVPARQYLLLAPGEYQLAGMGRPEAIKAARGLRWAVRCVEAGGAGRLVAASERFVGSGEWRRFAVDFAVDGSCAGHVLQLEPDADEGKVAFVEGTAWFDALGLRQR